jgi:hypothetical protein
MSLYPASNSGFLRKFTTYGLEENTAMEVVALFCSRLFLLVSTSDSWKARTLTA